MFFRTVQTSLPVWRHACCARSVVCLAIGVILQLSGVHRASAHEGPPFPIVMDKPVACYVVEVWTDPDIGEAQFFIIVKSPRGGPPEETPQVAMWVEPIGGRLERTTYQAKQQTLRRQLQFEAEPYFDQRDMWNVGFRITAPSGESAEFTTTVESTPPGYGPWDLAIYLFPFALLGGMWLVAMARRRRMASTRLGSNASRPDDCHRDHQFVDSGTRDKS